MSSTQFVEHKGISFNDEFGREHVLVMSLVMRSSLGEEEPAHCVNLLTHCSDKLSGSKVSNSELFDNLPALKSLSNIAFLPTKNLA